MKISKKVLCIVLIAACGMPAMAQKTGKYKSDKDRWVDANLYSKEDAVNFIRLAYESFTYFISKKETETGIYKRTIKLKGCELIIETDSRQQESSYKSDRNFRKNVLIVELDRVKLEGTELRPKDDTLRDGLYMGYNIDHTKKILAYSITDNIGDKDAERYTSQHFEDHLKWAYEFLIQECSAGQ